MTVNASVANDANAGHYGGYLTVDQQDDPLKCLGMRNQSGNIFNPIRLYLFACDAKLDSADPAGGIKLKALVEIDCSCLVSLSSYKKFVPTALGTGVPSDEHAA